MSRVDYLIAGAILGTLIGMAFHLAGIEAAIQRQTDFYLCIELAKLGGENISCEALLSRIEGSGE